jgi:hypothetical protein
MLNFITETIQVTEGGKYFPCGPHVGQPCRTKNSRHYSQEQNVVPHDHKAQQLTSYHDVSYEHNYRHVKGSCAVTAGHKNTPMYS